MTKITAKQREVLKYIIHTKNVFYRPPSTRDVRARFGFRSQTAAVNHINSLIKKGYLYRDDDIRKSLVITKEGYDEAQN